MNESKRAAALKAAKVARELKAKGLELRFVKVEKDGRVFAVFEFVESSGK